jgi:hypothetical protein
MQIEQSAKGRTITLQAASPKALLALSRWSDTVAHGGRLHIYKCPDGAQTMQSIFDPIPIRLPAGESRRPTTTALPCWIPRKRRGGGSLSEMRAETPMQISPSVLLPWQSAVPSNERVLLDLDAMPLSVEALLLSCQAVIWVMRRVRSSGL